MRKNMFRFALLPAVVLYALHTQASVPLDSIGTERLEGRVYVLHKVEQGQTLYSLLRRYRASMGDFEAANPGTEKEVKINQVVRLPYRGSLAAAGAATAPEQGEPVRKTNTARHTVLQGETLYAIARRYGVSPNDLKKWNNLPASGDLRICLLYTSPSPRD